MKKLGVRPLTAPPRKLAVDEQTFVELFRALEQSRRDMHTALVECLGFMNRRPALRQNWEAFIDSGGCTAAELRDQYCGTRRPRCKVFVHRHLLRCVVNNASPPDDSQDGQRNPSRHRVSYNNNNGNPPEAA